MKVTWINRRDKPDTAMKYKINIDLTAFKTTHATSQ